MWRSFFTCGVLCLLPLHPLLSAEAVFAPDGTTLYLLDAQERPGVVMSIDVATGIAKSISIQGLEEDETVISLDRSHDRELFLTTESTAYRWNPETNDLDKLVVAGADFHFSSIAFDPATESVAFTTLSRREDSSGEARLWIYPEGAGRPSVTLVRRVEEFSGIAFDSSGEFYFASQGDIWHGVIGEIDPDELPGGSLTAYRYAPLATRETTNGSPLEAGANSLIAAGPSLYAHVRRMGGSGWGNILRLEKPGIRFSDEGEAEFPETLEERLTTYQQALASVTVLADCETSAFLAATPDGNLVYFQGSVEGEEATHWLIREHGEPTPFVVTEEEASEE